MTEHPTLDHRFGLSVCFQRYFSLLWTFFLFFSTTICPASLCLYLYNVSFRGLGVRARVILAHKWEITRIGRTGLHRARVRPSNCGFQSPPFLPSTIDRNLSAFFLGFWQAVATEVSPFLPIPNVVSPVVLTAHIFCTYLSD